MQVEVIDALDGQPAVLPIAEQGAGQDPSHARTLERRGVRCHGPEYAHDNEEDRRMPKHFFGQQVVFEDIARSWQDHESGEKIHHAAT
jgi:hypothetical protein